MKQLLDDNNIYNSCSLIIIMRLYQDILATGAALLLTLTGCQDLPHQTGPLEGRVLKEFGTLARVSESCETNKEQTYGIVLETEEKTYILNINNHSLKPIFILEEAIQPGDRVKIYNVSVYEDNIGYTFSKFVEVTEKANAEK